MNLEKDNILISNKTKAKSIMKSFTSDQEEKDKHDTKVIIKGGKLKKAEEGGDRWITIRGRHVLVDSEGNVKQGGQGMADGKNIEKLRGSGEADTPPDVKEEQARAEEAKDQPPSMSTEKKQLQTKMKDVIDRYHGQGKYAGQRPDRSLQAEKNKLQREWTKLMSEE